MDVVTTVAELRKRVSTARMLGLSIGVVPTMGAFHEGHLELMRRARAECGYVVVTLFVNPTQFGANEDLSRYPRDLEADTAGAASTGADLLFAPPVEEVYPPGSRTWVTVEGLTSGLCGASRPTHFRGVTTVVAKLFNMAQPDRAYFGEKDYQQLRVIRQMTRDLDFPVHIVPCAIVREPDGLAMSSRNRYLDAGQRQAGLALRRGLVAAQNAFLAGERGSERLRLAALAVIADEPAVRLDYLELVDADDLTPVSAVEAPALLAGAIYVGTTRLIDNLVLTP